MKTYLHAALMTVMTALPVAAQDASTGTTGNGPNETSERYGGWTLHCTQQPEAGKSCEVLHVVRGQQGPVAQVAFGWPETGEAMLAVVRTPLGMNLNNPVTLTGGTEDVTLSWFLCLQTGCLARSDVAEAQMQSLATATELQLTFQDGGERPVDIALPVDGLSDALARLAEG